MDKCMLHLKTGSCDKRASLCLLVTLEGSGSELVTLPTEELKGSTTEGYGKTSNLATRITPEERLLLGGRKCKYTDTHSKAHKETARLQTRGGAQNLASL